MIWELVYEGGSSRRVDVPDPAAARAALREYLLSGSIRESNDYDVRGYAVPIVDGRAVDDEAVKETVTVEALPPPCEEEDHDWDDNDLSAFEQETGVRPEARRSTSSSPGAHAIADGVRMIDVCRVCGLRRVRDVHHGVEATRYRSIEGAS